MRMRRILTTVVVTPLLALAACDGSAPEPASGPSSTEATYPGGGPATPAAVPAAYSYVLTSSCGERSLIGTYRVWVEGDRVVRAEPVGRVSRPALEDVSTIADLEAKIEHAGPEAVVKVKRDGAGLLTSVSIDPRQDTIDDEECYEVSGLRGRPAGAG